jgi:tyrosyl-tRNA synthetase
MNDQITDLLSRGVEEVIDKSHLEQALNSKKKLRVKLGIDPTSPNIHIGRAVALWKLRAFQDAGHTAIFIVGDFTGLVGDTSDKESERPMLTEKEVKANLKTYFAQAYKILDKKKTEVYYNSKWLKKLGFIEIAKMANLFGLHEMEAREVIARRMKAGKRVSLQEMMYPIMQGYDSVAVKADVELGGTDQRFNLLAGRTIQPLYNQEPQDILMTTLMEGTDGRKMSSSWGNVINLTDEPNDMFGKVMSIKDDLIAKYFLLATRVPIDEIKLDIEGNPRDYKITLAKEIVKLYHGQAAAYLAAENFINTFSKKEFPQNPITIETDKGAKLADLLVEKNIVASKSEWRRLVENGAVSYYPEKKVTDSNETIKDGESKMRIGKKVFIKIIAK